MLRVVLQYEKYLAVVSPTKTRFWGEGIRVGVGVGGKEGRDYFKMKKNKQKKNLVYRLKS